MFPKNLKELQDLIVRLFRPTTDSLRKEKADKAISLTINGITQDLSEDRTWTVTGGLTQQQVEGLI